MHDIYKFWLGTTNSKGEIDRVAFWTCINAVSTAILLLIGWYQLRGLKKTSKADFIKKFTDDFFNPETQKLIILLNYKALEFKFKEIFNDNHELIDEFPYFIINEKIIRQLPVDKTTQKSLLDKDTYTAFEIDDLLLGYFEDIGCFEKDNLIGIKAVYDGFDWYLDTAWNDLAIAAYVIHTRASENDGNDIYENFEYIYNKDKSYRETKTRFNNNWLWNFRWKLSNFILKR